MMRNRKKIIKNDKGKRDGKKNNNERKGQNRRKYLKKKKGIIRMGK